MFSKNIHIYPPYIAESLLDRYVINKNKSKTRTTFKYYISCKMELDLTKKTGM